MNKKLETIYRIREFNRFYTVLLGFLDSNFLDSGFSITETRILFELSSHDDCSANDLVKKLHIDKSYLSRIIKRFQNNGLLSKQVSEQDARSFRIRLTDAGKAATNQLIEKSNQQISQLLDPLSANDCTEICQAIDTLIHHLSQKGGTQNAQTCCKKGRRSETGVQGR